MERGAYTTYTIKHSEGPLVTSFVEAILSDVMNGSRVECHKKYSHWSSPLRHLYWGWKSQKTFGREGLPSA